MKRLITAAVLSLAAATAAQSQIVINEICTGTDTLAYKQHSCDWVELYNAGSADVNLKGYTLSDNPKKPRKHVIDCDAVIKTGGHIVILCNDLGTGLNAGFKLSSDGGEEVVLSNPNEEIIDQVTTPRLQDDFSYGRLTDGASSWGIFDVATPGQRNSNAKALAPTPVISPTAGFFTMSQKVSITCSDPSATIYYTTDGSTPSKSSKKYTAAFTVGKTTAVRAIAISSGCKDSRVATTTYFINDREMTLPVVSLVTDNKNFYDNRIGIYVEGTNGVAGKCSDNPVNWNQDWERPVHIEYFDKNQILQLSQDAGVKITGTCSRTNAMKSLRIIARKQYGDSRLRYKFFDKKDISEFKSIVLRNGGNDFQGTMLRDALITGLAASGGMDVDVQALQPVAVFLNGEYLGMHNMREKVSDHFAEENYGVESDLVDLLEYKGENKSFEDNIAIIDGDNKDFVELMKFVKNNSLANKTNYEKVAAQIDIDNFIDYWVAQIYVDNEDWPMNNNKWWRARGKNTKWRWILFGTEYSCGVYGGQPTVNSVWRDIDINSDGWSTTEWSTRLMRKLLENEEFKAKFLQRFTYHMDHTFKYARVKEFSDSLRNLVKTEFLNYQAPKYYSWLGPSWWGGSSWESNIDNLNSWFEQRPKQVSQHLRDYFHISSRYDVTVSADINNVKFSVNHCPSTAYITGRYFADVNLNLSAVLPEGKAVNYWNVTDANGNEKKIYTEEIDLMITNNVVVKLYTKDATPATLPARTTQVAGLYVNEIMPYNKGALSDETGHFPGWIEFYNDNNYAIDMAGLYIFNNDKKAKQYQIPGGSSDLTTIPAKGHLVFFADGKPELGALHMNYTLKEDKENSVNLGQILNGENLYIDYMDAPTLKKNQSYGRSSDGNKNLVTFVESTPFAKNSTGKVEATIPTYTYTGDNQDVNPNDNPNTAVSEHVVASSTLNVYPNPTNDYARIDSESEDVSYALYNIAGEKLTSGTGKEIDLTNLPSGMYVLQAYVGGSLKNVKVIKR